MRNELKEFQLCDSRRLRKKAQDAFFFVTGALCLSASRGVLRLTRLPHHDRGPYPEGIDPRLTVCVACKKTQRCARCCFEIFQVSSFSRADETFEILEVFEVFSLVCNLQGETLFEIFQIFNFNSCDKALEILWSRSGHPRKLLEF